MSCRLGDLRPGDTAEITRADGVVAIFTVDAVRQYLKTAFPSSLVYHNAGHPSLRLITCGGSFGLASETT